MYAQDNRKNRKSKKVRKPKMAQNTVYSQSFQGDIPEKPRAVMKDKIQAQLARPKFEGETTYNAQFSSIKGAKNVRHSYVEKRGSKQKKSIRRPKFEGSTVYSKSFVNPQDDGTANHATYYKEKIDYSGIHRPKFVGNSTYDADFIAPPKSSKKKSSAAVPTKKSSKKVRSKKSSKRTSDVSQAQRNKFDAKYNKSSGGKSVSGYSRSHISNTKSNRRSISRRASSHISATPAEKINLMSKNKTPSRVSGATPN
jgi:hypothetical protein